MTLQISLKNILGMVGLSLLLWACGPQKQDKPLRDYSPELIHRLNDRVTQTILQDGFSPPVASRIYAYCNIAAYEIVALADDRYASLAGQLNGLEAVKFPQPKSGINWGRVLVDAYCGVAKQMVYRDYLIEDIQVSLKKEMSGGKLMESVEEEMISAHLVNHILDWAGGDGYKESRNFPLFTPSLKPGSWRPTPPSYAEAIEPYWAGIRPFVIDSAAQFRPNDPIRFSTDPNSEFYKATLTVYEAVNNLDEGRLGIAKHWDCNPYLSLNKGHLMFGKRQLTPGGHWMGITRTAARQAKFDLSQSVEAYLYTSLALADGFISCWEAKYRTNLIRPETYINEYIDPKWRPLLETPEFPEHTSGHSVISTATATVLTHVFGEDFAFTDSVNVPYGLPPRSFGSFIEACNEAAISRLYGGIHYLPAIEYGQSQGKAIGKFIAEKLKTASEKP